MTAKKIIDKKELLENWDFEKNEKEKLYPELIRVNEASIKCWWICEKNHSIKLLPISKSKNPSCRVCCDFKPVKDYKKSLEFLEPNITKEWNYERNNLKPNQVYSKSSKIVWWKCIFNHEWEAEIGRRATRNSNCPYCSNKKLFKGFNDLSTQRPDLIKELIDPKINPSLTLFNSSKKALWKCKNNHEWIATINSRTRNSTRTGSNCPKCSTNISKPEKDLKSLLKNLHSSTYGPDRLIIKPLELDIVIPSEKIAIEFNGDYWHSCHMVKKRYDTTAFEYHSKKSKLAHDAGYTLLYVWESDWNDDKDYLLNELIKTIETKRISDIFLRFKSILDEE